MAARLPRSPPEDAGMMGSQNGARTGTRCGDLPARTGVQPARLDAHAASSANTRFGERVSRCGVRAAPMDGDRVLDQRPRT
jgi:hypothetical protein